MKLIISLTLVLLWSSEALSFTQEQINHENYITKIAKERCDNEQIKGINYKTKALGDGKLEVSLFGKKGAKLKGIFIYTKEEWEGAQRVIKDHQLTETINRRVCIENQTNSLKLTYQSPKHKDLKTYMLFRSDVNRAPSGYEYIGCGDPNKWAVDHCESNISVSDQINPQGGGRCGHGIYKITCYID